MFVASKTVVVFSQIFLSTPILIIGFGNTIIETGIEFEHCPAFGVNVYVPEIVLLTTDGDQVPITPFVEIIGNVGVVAPLQNGAIGINIGVTVAVMVTGNVAVVAHWPAFGVNVYTADVVLLTTAGFHVPVMPLVDVVGKTGTVAPLQMAGIAVNVGVVFASTVMVNGTVAKHPGPLAVKVYVLVVVLLTVAGLQVPVTPLIDVVGKTGAVAPLHIEAIGLNVGVTIAFTTTDKVVALAQSPTVGVKVYVPLAVLLTEAGLQVPVIPLVEVVGKIGAKAPLHIGAIAAKVGVITAFTVTDKLAVLAQSPTVGVKVYVPLAVLLTVAGLQVPVIPLVDVVGKTGAVAPLQIAGTAANVGVTFGFIVTVKLAVFIQLPELAVKTYVPVVVLLTTAGFQVPAIPLVDVVSKTGAVAPLQIAAIAANVGVVVGFTVINIFVVVAHCPTVGVKT
jgi:hypothetical protein